MTRILSPQLAGWALTLEIADCPDFEDGLFDAVLFTRSLHHIHPVDKAVQRAADSLFIGGRLIVEDFAYETADQKTLQWFAAIIDQLGGEGLLVQGNDFLSAFRSKNGMVANWRANHEAALHTATDILAEIRRVFGKTQCEEVPYYFRYLSRANVPTADRDKILRDSAEQEGVLISRGVIRALGRRFVAERRNKS